MVKRHYKKKLIELREKYKSYQPLEGDNQFIHSLCFVQTILGDLYFYDKEYDEAILYYTESIQTLRLPNNIDKRFLTRHQYLIWLRNTLKIGLTLEKIEAYDSAKSLYRTLMLDSQKYLSKIVNINLDPYTEEITSEGIFKTKKTIKTKFDIDGIDPRSEGHRNMHLLTLPFVAHLAAIEKLRVDGITYSDLYQNKEELRNIIEPNYNLKYLDDPKQKLYLLNDEYRKGWLWSDYFSNVGSILFYKNCQFTRFFTPNVWDENGGFTEEKKNQFRAFENSEFSYTTRKYQKNEYSNQFDESFYLKTDFPNLFEKLHKHYNKNVKSRSNRIGDFFPSLSSLCYYWESLNELTKYHQNRIKKGLTHEKYSRKDLIYNPLQYAAFYLLPDFIDMVSGKRFYYLANMVSKIGDAILASISQIDTNFMSYDEIKDANTFIQNLRHKENNESVLLNCIDSLFCLTDELFSFKKVFSIYILSSELYRRSGQDYYYTFAQKKDINNIKGKYLY